MHSKSHKICTLKFLGCNLAQRVLGSKVEAKESTEISKALNWMSRNQVYSVGWSDAQVLTHVEWVLQPTDSKWTVRWTDGTGIGSSDALGFGYSSGQGSTLKHRTIRWLDHRFIRWLHLNSTETRQDPWPEQRRYMHPFAQTSANFGIFWCPKLLQGSEPPQYAVSGEHPPSE
jgi:hypothetical protein